MSDRWNLWKTTKQRGLLGLALVGLFCVGNLAVAQPSAEKRSAAKEVFGRLVPLSDADVKAIDEAINELGSVNIDACRDKLAAARTKNKQLPPASMMLVRILVAAQQTQAAVAELEKCVLDNPTDPDAYLFQGDLAMQQGMVTAADLLFQHAEKLVAEFKDSPDRLRDFQIRLNAGAAAVLEAREKWTDAKARLEKWIAVDAKTPLDTEATDDRPITPEMLRRAAAQQRLASVLVQLGDYPAALAASKAAGALNPEMPTPAVNVGLLCYQSAMRAKANAAAIKDEKNAKKAELDTKAKALETEATKQMGVGYGDYNKDNFLSKLIDEVKKADADLAAAEKKGGDTSAAKKAATAAQLKKARTLRGLLAIADFLLMTDKKDAAQNVSEAAILLDPKSVDAKTQRGIVARFKKDYKKAEENLSEAQQMAPGSFLAVNHLALVLAEQGQELDASAQKLEEVKKDSEAKQAREKARELKQRALEYAVINQKSNNKNVEAAATVAWVSYLRGDYNAAGQVLEKIVQAGGLSADSAYYVGRILVDMKRWEIAENFLKAADTTTVPFFHKDENAALLKEVSKKVEEIKADRKKEEDSKK